MTDMRNNKSQMAETETNNNKTLKEIFSEEIRAELASGRTKKPTFEEFKEMVEKEKAKRCKKYTAIAACFVAALVVGFFAFDMMADDVGADKNPKETIQTEDGVIIEDGGWGSTEGKDAKYVIEEWEYIEDAKTLVPNLPIPQYIPEKYIFNRLEIELMTTGGARSSYLFLDSNGNSLEIEIFDHICNSTSFEISNVFKLVETKYGTLYFQNDENKATIQNDDDLLISVWSILSEKEIVEIVEGLN